jgi:hypothetical protein
MRWVNALGLAVGLAAGARLLGAQTATAPYARPAPLEQYLMPRNAEIALARSAAPAAISRQATILVLGHHGYTVALHGTNGFVCLVERSWVGTFDWPEVWNPKVRGADCLNPAAARSILPIEELRARLVMAGEAPAATIRKVEAAIRAKQLPALEPGAMSYMMGKRSYLTDEGNHNGPHLMFWVATNDAALWGANEAGSPLNAANYWFVAETPEEAHRFPPLTVFTVSVAHWSDGTPAR